jgi:OmpA-OmpF porin, OOP family
VKEFKNIAIIAVFAIISLPMVAQDEPPVDVNRIPAKKLKLYAMDAYRTGDVYSAIDFLQPYCDLKPNDAEMNFRLGELYFASRDYQKAEDIFARVYKSQGEDYPLALYYGAECMRSQGKYAEAKDIFLKFQRKLKFVKDCPVTPGALKEEISSCDSALSIMRVPLKLTVGQLGSSVNGPHEELSPVQIADGEMLYASLQMDGTYYFSKGDTTPLPVRQFYIAKKAGADWIGGKPMEGPVNIPGVETCNGAFSRDGKRFYFTRCGHTLGKMRCELYVTLKNGDTWEEPEILDPSVNDPNYTSTQPTIGYTSKSNMEVIYFVSNRPGGKGGMDIWYTIYDPRKKTYRLPRNAGKVNTSGDEMTPFYDHTTRTLYYSSTGHQGLGGFDIFKSSGEMRKWLPPQNCGYPLNSSYDDLYFSIGKNREDGFLVSNRPNPGSYRNPSCCDDIYQYRWTDFVRVAVKGTVYPAEAAKLGKNLDQARLLAMKDSIKPLERAIIALYKVDKKTKEKVFIDRDTTGVDGAYYFDLEPEKDYKFEMEGAQYFNEQVNISTEGVNFTYTIEMPPIWVNVLNDKPIVLKNVYYDFNKSDLSLLVKKNIDSTLYELMLKATDIIVEVSAHTDSVGNADYNKKLSQDRADNVVKYLVGKGISKKRLIARGYGSSKPVAPNYKPDHSDNPEGREKNRRTEFRVVGTLSSQVEDVDTEEIQ